MASQTPDKYRPLEDDGLQVNFIIGCGPELVRPDHEGLYPAPINENSLKETYVDDSSRTSATVQPEEATPSRRSKLKLFIAAGVIGVIILLAVILGAVLGARHSESPDSATQASATATVGSSGPGNSSSNAGGTNTRVRSTSGAWNGTGLSLAYAYNSHFWSWIFYQDWTGALVAGQYNLSDNGSPFMTGKTVVNTASGSVKAANGTGLAGVRHWDRNKNMNTYQLVYTAPNGTLCDLWLLDSDVSSSTRVTGVWTAGVLSALNFQAPTDSRPAFYMKAQEDWYGDVVNKSNSAARLWAGGTDGKVHQYSWKGDGGQWYNGTYTFQDSHAYGALYAVSDTRWDSPFNTTLYTSAADGTLQYRVQSPGGDPQWPVGGEWSDPVSAPAGASKVSAGSSVTVQWERDTGWGSYVYYPADPARMGAYELDLKQPLPKQLKAYDADFESVRIMPGSDMAHESNPSGSMVHFQREGNDICWQYVNSDLNLKGCLDVS